MPSPTRDAGVSFAPDKRYDIRLELGQARERALARMLWDVAAVTIECKSQQRSGAYGSVFVEHQRDGRPSGIATTEADVWAIETAPDRWVIVTTEELRELWALAIIRRGERETHADGSQHAGAVVPLAWLLG